MLNQRGFMASSSLHRTGMLPWPDYIPPELTSSSARESFPVRTLIAVSPNPPPSRGSVRQWGHSDMASPHPFGLCCLYPRLPQTGPSMNKIISPLGCLRLARRSLPVIAGRGTSHDPESPGGGEANQGPFQVTLIQSCDD